MKCLVIGATGIIGNHIVRELLQDGHEVSALSRGLTPSLNLEGLGVNPVRADLSDAVSLQKAFRGHDWVFHAAGYYPKNAFGMNRHVRTATEQTENVIAAALEAGVKKLVYTSSLTTIGRAAPGAEADESLPYGLDGRDPHPYFRVKHLAEERFRRAAREQALPVTIVNPTGCFGPYELKPRELCLIPQLARRRIPAYVERPLNVVDTADVARGHVLAALKGRIGERYILGGHNTNTSGLLGEICSVIGVKPPRLKAPLSLALALAYAAETYGALAGRQPIFPVLGLRFVQYGQFTSSAKAERELGYRAHPMKECFTRAYAWYKKINYC